MAASGGKKRNSDSTESLAFLNREPRTSVYVFSHLQAYIFMHFHVEAYGLGWAVTEKY